MGLDDYKQGVGGGFTNPGLNPQIDPRTQIDIRDRVYPQPPPPPPPPPPVPGEQPPGAMTKSQIISNHYYVHRYFNIDEVSKETEVYTKQKYVEAHAKLVAAMIDAGVEHVMEDSLDETLPEYLKQFSSKTKKSTKASESKVDFELGELCTEEIDIKPLMDTKELTKGDSDPFFVTVKALHVGKSLNKKIYTMENLKQVKRQLPLYGYLGHINEKDLSHLYRAPVTVWIGGEIVNDWLYLKGYVPPQYKTLREDVALSIRAKKPMPVSILGFYKLEPQGEYYRVLDIYGLSVDWANDKLEGIPGAHVVRIGKEQINLREEDMTRGEFLAALTTDEIKTARPDLVKSLETEFAKENVDLKKKILDAHREKLLGEVKDEKVREIAGDLLQGETTEELDKSWKLVKEKLGKLERPGMPIISGADGKRPGAEFIADRLLVNQEA